MTQPVLLATYRLQLNREFTLHDALERVPYLKALGVSHLYLSPVLAARAGSMHGYDVADPTHVSEELGGSAAFVALANAVHAQGMGIMLDIVPNHMGIGPDNPYWDDLLAHGRSSRYADWFDVAWRAPTKRLANKVLVPILGDTLGKVLERSEITVDASDDGVRVCYFDHHFPLDPSSLPPELELAQRDPSARGMLAEWGKGEEGCARLTALLAKQHYELAFWRVAQRDLNYRRFFDVNELICLRVEHEDVFEATHRTLLQFVADGHVDGLRVDHIDGLLEPKRYLERLRSAVDTRRPSAAGEPRFPIVVEKILAPGETLPADWPIDGTTGYEFMVALEDIFIDPAGYQQIETRYRGTREGSFHDIALAAKRRVLRGGLNADVRRIAPMLAGIARRAGWTECTIAAYAGAIVELVAVLPVYRTYIDAQTPRANERDRVILTTAFAKVRENPEVDAEAASQLERALLDDWSQADRKLASRRLAFVLRWQQLTGPAAAKGVEDTALYLYAPLASRNEVGGDPGVAVEGAVERLHARLSERAKRFPRSLNATNTHDTKRSADVRARLDALSESPRDWERMVRQWRGRHRPLQTLVKGKLAPTRTTDHFIYQSLVGIWPAEGARSHDDAWLADVRDRMSGYMQKALREAKASTNWTDPDAQYEKAIDDFLTGVLDQGKNREFLRVLDEFVLRIAPQGVWNALARLTIHLTAPGVPDLYRGDELWFQALVDPDNRRTVDWEVRARALDDVSSAAADDVRRMGELREWRDMPRVGDLKMYLIHELLAFRRSHQFLMSDGDYEPLRAEGEHAHRVVAFRRTHGDSQMIVVVPRLTGALGPLPVGGAWGDTSLRLAAAETRTWRSMLDGTSLACREGNLRVGEVLAELPVAVLNAE